MRLPDYVTTAQTNLLRTKVRTFLTILAFVIGTFTLGMVTAFTQGLRSYLNTQLNAYGQQNLINVSIGKSVQQTSSSGVPYYQPDRQATISGGPKDKVAAFTLNQNDLSAVKSTPGIVAAYPDYSTLNIDYIQYQNAQKFVIQAQSAYPGETTALSAGSFPTSSQTASIVLPYDYVESLGFQKPDQLVGKTVSMQVTSEAAQTHSYTATVTGVLPDTVHQPAAYLSYQLINDMVQFQTGSTTQFTDIIALAQNNVTKPQRLQIKNALQAKGYNAQTYDDIIANFNRPLSIITAGLTGFAAIALLAATIGIINTLLMSVLERTQEIGLLKALGMRKRGVTFIYLVEAASIGFWGGIIGVVLAFLLGLAANPILNRTLFKGIGSARILTYPLPYMIDIVIGAMIIGLIAGTLPAVRAGRLDPIDALRRE